MWLSRAMLGVIAGILVGYLWLVEDAVICYYSMDLAISSCYQHHPSTQSETKLGSVQGLMRFGKLLHLPYALSYPTQASFTDAKILVKGIHISGKI